MRKTWHTPSPFLNRSLPWRIKFNYFYIFLGWRSLRILTNKNCRDKIKLVGEEGCNPVMKWRLHHSSALQKPPHHQWTCYLIRRPSSVELSGLSVCYQSVGFANSFPGFHMCVKKVSVSECSARHSRTGLRLKVGTEYLPSHIF